MELMDDLLRPNPFEPQYTYPTYQPPVSLANDAQCGYAKWDERVDYSPLFAQPQPNFCEYSHGEADTWFCGTPYTAYNHGFSPAVGFANDHASYTVVNGFNGFATSNSVVAQLSPLSPSIPQFSSQMLSPSSAFTPVNPPANVNHGQNYASFSIDGLIDAFEPAPTLCEKSTEGPSRSKPHAKQVHNISPMRLYGSPQPLISCPRAVKTEALMTHKNNEQAHTSASPEMKPCASLLSLARPSKKRRSGPPAPFNSGRGTFLFLTKGANRHNRQFIWRIDGRSRVDRCLLLKYHLCSDSTGLGYVYERTQKYIYADSRLAQHFEVLGKVSHVYKHNCAPVDRVMVAADAFESSKPNQLGAVVAC